MPDSIAVMTETQVERLESGTTHGLDSYFNGKFAKFSFIIVLLVTLCYIIVVRAQYGMIFFYELGLLATYALYFGIAIWLGKFGGSKAPLIFYSIWDSSSARFLSSAFL
ncbi:MAG TPA: hypothetical protein VMV49_15940 [Candidatus Deferrimicrobium sp.]|nr:hypothetical protein [Candidatus Deferrimicrobium sp.]